MSSSEHIRDGDGPLAIICGGGSIPYVVADAVMRQGRRAVLFALRGWADPAAVERYPHYWTTFGQMGRFRRLAREEGCRDVVLIGYLVRPTIRQVRFDLTTLRLLPRIVRIFRGGDNHLLKGFAGILEDQGFRVLGAHEVAPEILVPEGTLGRHRPSARDLADIDRAMHLLAATGPFDIGQAVVVADHQVVAVEAMEGTDLMLARIAELRGLQRILLPPHSGVLVKAPKPGQDRRIDLPSIGPRTVEAAAAASLAGIAVEAGGSVTADFDLMIEAADAAGLFVYGIRRGRVGE
jgi:DUF1009 family protein